ncbi:hypothetical protein PWT90_09727 [Aphanocladium album]|nr:hypothetical protein PWT90_09727 [Aphanocladium album]
MPPDGRAGITASLVQRLLDSQFPHWGHLLIRPVRKDGWDNRTYRLGDSLTVRLPTTAGYEDAVAKESKWLPRLAPALPLAIPAVQGSGTPERGYAHAWSVRSWIAGETLESGAEAVEDWDAVADALGRFIHALQGCDAAGGPMAGAHCWFRGCSLKHYDAETQRALKLASGSFDRESAAAVWQAALTHEWEKLPVWFHGDLSAGNLLVSNGKLSAVIDFGTCGIGDPACDLVPAWTIFAGSSRKTFEDAVMQDSATWARARGWALWKALLTLADVSQSLAEKNKALAVLSRVIEDHEQLQSL